MSGESRLHLAIGSVIREYDSSGRTVEARIVAIDKKNVTIKRASGAVVQVPLSFMADMILEKPKG
jgi:hypothetical protein